MAITNTHKTPIGLPGGVVLQPNTPTPVHNWDEIRKNAVVQAWIKAGILVDNEQVNSKFLQADKDEVLAKLAALGLYPDKRTGVAKLQEMLADAERASDAAVTNVPQEASLGSGPFRFRG